MKTRIANLCVFVLLIALCGCKREPQRDIVLLLDTSQSITPDSVRDEFKFAEALVDRMHRGDRLTIIPITGSAISETPGHVLYFSVPVHREAYDHDLVVFRQQAHEQIQAMRDAAVAHPSKRTDIFGALDLAQEALTADADKGRNKALIIFSDFLEDEGTYHFVTDKELADGRSVAMLAGRLREEHGLQVTDAHVYLGSFVSTDMGRLTSPRQRAVQAFWKAYLKPATISKVELNGSGF